MTDDEANENTDDIKDLLAFGLLGYGVVVDENGPHVSSFARDGFYVRDDPPEPFIGADGIPWIYRFTGPDGKDYFSPLLNASQGIEIGQAMVDGLREGLEQGKRGAAMLETVKTPKDEDEPTG